MSSNPTALRRVTILSASLGGVIALFAGCAGAGPPQLGPSNSSLLISQGTGAIRNMPIISIANMPWRSQQRSLKTVSLSVRSWIPGINARIHARTYVGQYYVPAVLQYPRFNKADHAPLCSVPGQSVNGIAVDSNDNLWVPNGTGKTIEYAPNCGKQLLSISDPDGQPGDAAFDSNGNIFISNVQDVGSTPGSINVYDSRGHFIRSLSSPLIEQYIVGIAVDANDNVFVSEGNGGVTYGGVVEFPKGKMPGTLLSGVQQIALIGGIQFDSAGNLLVDDWDNAVIDVYAPPFTSISKVLYLREGAIWCPLSKDEKSFTCASFISPAVDVYSYPSGNYIYSYNKGLKQGGLLQGIANAPSAPN